MSNAQPVLVIGGDGLIGQALVRCLRGAGAAVLATSRRPGSGDLHLDLAEPDGWPALPAAAAVVMVAAVARLADCEREPVISRKVNVEAPARLTEAMAARGSYCLLLSTDKVFDGSQPLRRRDDRRCPLTEYGGQKAAAERAVLAAGGAVLRLSKVLSPELALLQEWRQRLLAGQPITPFEDMRLAPVELAMVTTLISHLVADRRGGIFHCTGADDRTYAELARIVAAALGADDRLIRPAAAARQSAGSVLVAHSSLEMSREQAFYGIGNPSFAAVAGSIAAALAG